jgi:hypothetical protein
MDEYEYYIPQNDYDYFDFLNTDARSIVENPVNPSGLSPEDEFDDYMDELCEYMLFKTPKQTEYSSVPSSPSPPQRDGVVYALEKAPSNQYLQFMTGLNSRQSNVVSPVASASIPFSSRPAMLNAPGDNISNQILDSR